VRPLFRVSGAVYFDGVDFAVWHMAMKSWLAIVGLLGLVGVEQAVAKPIVAKPIGVKPIGVKPIGRSVNEAKTFLDWCLLPEKSAGVKATVEAVFQAVGTKRCGTAAVKVEGLKRLDLSGMGVRDLRPIGALGQITVLVLDRNPVRDLQPLVGLKQLEVLSLNRSSVKDLGAVSQMPGLKALAIDGTFVRDLTAVAGLNGLREFSAQADRIEDIAPLTGLTNLRYLALSRNNIEELTPLTALTNLEELYLNDNKIKSVKPISGLVLLRTLALNNNRIKGFEPLLSLPSLQRLELLGMPTELNPCPVMPKSGICLYHQVPTVEPRAAEKPLELAPQTIAPETPKVPKSVEKPPIGPINPPKK
jgi:internalin A